MKDPPGANAGGGGDGGVPACTPVSKRDGPCAQAIWTANIYPLVTGKWTCTLPSCHGGTSKPDIAGADANRAYDQLRAASAPPGGKPYINPCSLVLTDSSFHCNLDKTCGTPMPIGPVVDPADLALLKTFVECGAPK